jgi:hypothetical protein
MIVIKDVDSTVHKVDAVHDPMQFEHDGDPNLQKKHMCYNISGQ